MTESNPGFLIADFARTTVQFYDIDDRMRVHEGTRHLVC